eukprot:TRINITY_DN105_c0_g1_i9.p1 TRINITY_DN105_c0_g1~~TRINITY_DN105_c0_g1_i9.p1  ORF type:complete len:502 (+),score=83.00 TRINITY_DN105_c0_g1_i9:779-2284(+)
MHELVLHCSHKRRCKDGVLFFGAQVLRDFSNHNGRICPNGGLRICLTFCKNLQDLPVQSCWSQFWCKCYQRPHGNLPQGRCSIGKSRNDVGENFLSTTSSGSGLSMNAKQWYQRRVHGVHGLSCIRSIQRSDALRQKNLTQLRNIHPQLHSLYKRMLQTKPQQRATVNNLRSLPYIAKNPAVRAVAFVDDIALKSEEAKSKFYKSLGQIVEMIPESCARYRILPAMINQLQFGAGSNPTLLATVLKLGKKLTDEERETMIIPAVSRMFENNERSTRINLLKNIKLYIEFVPDDVVEKKIFPNVVSGFADTTPTLREVSVRSLIAFAPKLAPATLNGKVLQILAKCQTDAQPAIRTNTTVVIGEIAQYLSTEKQHTVLATAFVRTMKDKFVHARKASVLAVEKCIELFTIKQMVGALLPQLAKLTVDPYKSVRDPALKTVKKIVSKLQKHAADMPEEPKVQLSSDGAKERRRGAIRRRWNGQQLRFLGCEFCCRKGNGEVIG